MQRLVVRALFRLSNCGAACSPRPLHCPTAWARRQVQADAPLGAYMLHLLSKRLRKATVAQQRVSRAPLLSADGLVGDDDAPALFKARGALRRLRSVMG